MRARRFSRSASSDHCSNGAVKLLQFSNKPFPVMGSVAQAVLDRKLVSERDNDERRFAIRHDAR